MNERKIFTTDPQYFPVEKMREIVTYLHDHDQQYSTFLRFVFSCRTSDQFEKCAVMMVDPAVAYTPNTGYGTLDRGLKDDVFLKNPNGTNHLGVVWPGM